MWLQVAMPPLPMAAFCVAAGSLCICICCCLREHSVICDASRLICVSLLNAQVRLAEISLL